MKLSIVIPSYNRNTVVLRNLPRLLAQMVDGVELQILDNASPTPLSETLAPVLAQYPQVRVNLVRHRANVGAAANILRSFEIAHAPWLWILGDDDVITTTAVQDLLAEIERRPDCAFMNFSTSVMHQQGQRSTAFDTVGQRGFVEGVDHPGNVNFMSVGLWHAPSFTGALHLAYHYAYSMSPTFVLLLAALGDKGRCHFSDRVLVDTVTTAEAATKWRFRDFITGWNTILELPMADDTRTRLARKMYSWHVPENVCVYLLAEAAARHERGRHFVLVSHRLAPYLSAWAHLRYLMYRPLFWAPQLSWPIVAAAVRLAVRLRIKGIDLDDIVERARY